MSTTAAYGRSPLALGELARVAGECRVSASTTREFEPESTIADGLETWAERLEKAAGVEPQRHLAVVMPIR